MPDPQRQVGQFMVKVNSKELPAEVMSSLDEALVEDDLAQPTMFSLRFDDPEHKLIDGTLFPLGAEVAIAAASKINSSPNVLLTGEITALEAHYEQDNMVLTVRGYDRSHRLQRGSKTRTFVKQSDSDIASQIAREAGLRADVEATNGQIDYVIQDNQTDLQFLHARAARIGYRVVVQDKTLSFRRAEGSPPSAPAQEWGQTLLAFQSRLTAVTQPNEVQVRGWDPKSKRALVGKASRPVQPAHLGAETDGGKAAERAFGSGATRAVCDQPVRTQAEADSLAQSVLDSYSGDYLAVEGTCLGEPTLKAGTTVELKGLGKQLSGSYFVSATRHSYTPRENYQTTFFVNGRRAGGLLAAVGDPPRHAVTGVVVGIVTNNKDPDNLGRVKITFPWLDDQQESDWARLAAPGAGSERGLFVVPEIDDEVLVAFEHGDMSRPFVVGGLWNGKDKPPESSAVQGSKVQRRTLKTRVGHQIAFDDSDGKGKIEIVTAGGQKLVLEDQGPGKLTITSPGEVEIKGAGGKLSITAQGVELSSKKELTIQGTIVNIN